MDNSVLEGSNVGLFDREASSHRSRQHNLGLPQTSSFTHWCPTGLSKNLDPDQQFGITENRGSLRKGSVMSVMKGKSSGPCHAAETADVSEDEERSFAEEGNEEGAQTFALRNKSKKVSPWQRMKWTDNDIRLLIAVVARVGDDGGFDGVGGFKRKSRILQKKGKWKTVSKIMNSKGAHVSPQQCEDKFNDLNKRYKKLNEILGKGTSCQVVENPVIMDLMPKISGKDKDTVRKILSSKHLFYREMCAYHSGQVIPNCPEIDVQGSLGKGLKENNLSEDEDAEDSEGSHGENDDYESNGSFDEEGGSSKHIYRSSAPSAFEVEVEQILKNSDMPMWEKSDWIEKKRMQLLNQTFNIQVEGLEIDKQRLRWLRYRCKMDDQFESLKQEKEKMRLENEHGMLFLKRKQLEIELQVADKAGERRPH